MPVLHADGHHLALLEPQMLLKLQRMLHDLLIPAAVGLRPQGVYRGAFAAVEHPILDARLIGRAPHFAPQRVQFAHQMAFPRAADGRIAGHIPHRVKAHREAYGIESQPRGGQRGLNPGMTRPDDRDITFSSVVCSHNLYMIPQIRP